MSELGIVKTCPLGSVCRDARDGVIYECEWLVKLKGSDPQDPDIIYDEHRCAISWLPILMTETSKFTRGTTQAIESFRNEMVNQNDLIKANQIIALTDHMRKIQAKTEKK